MAKEIPKEEMMYCPVGRVFSDLEKFSRKKSPFFDHLKNSRVEFLKAVRSLFDQRIDSLEKASTKGGKRMSKSEAG
jgi:hypothetical protein